MKIFLMYLHIIIAQDSLELFNFNKKNWTNTKAKIPKLNSSKHPKQRIIISKLRTWRDRGRREWERLRGWVFKLYYYKKNIWNVFLLRYVIYICLRKFAKRHGQIIVKTMMVPGKSYLEKHYRSTGLPQKKFLSLIPFALILMLVSALDSNRIEKLIQKYQ